MEKQPLKGLVEEKRVVNINQIHQENRTFGERVSDVLAQKAGSWGFILSFLFLLVAWIFLNSLILKKPLDPYPFILLNLILSCIAALQAPIIMMSQNRQNERDRVQARNDYITNRAAKREIEALHKSLSRIERRKLDLILELLLKEEPVRSKTR